MMEVTGKKSLRIAMPFSQKYTKFWEKGFEILQNIEDRATLQKKLNMPKNKFQWQPLTKSQMRPTKTKQIFQIFIRWQTYLKLAYNHGE
jgi:hypothetical protein